MENSRKGRGKQIKKGRDGIDLGKKVNRDGRGGRI
jgi:hypothetical protein